MFAASESTASGSIEGNHGQQPSKCCKFYSLNRWCRYGNRCKYLHERHSTAWNTEAPRYSHSRTVRSSTYKRPQEEFTLEQRQNTPANQARFIVGPEADEKNEAQEGIKEELPSQAKISNESEKESQTIPEKIPECLYFSKNGWCRYNNRCRFIHQRRGDIPRKPFQGRDARQTTSSSESATHLHRAFGNEILVSKPRAQNNRVCFYYAKGVCKRNENCRYAHPNPVCETTPNNLSKDASSVQRTMDEDDSILEMGAVTFAIEPVADSAKHSRPPMLKKELLLAELTADELSEQRNVEIIQLKKRFPKDRIIELDISSSYVVTVTPTDPDWPFAVKGVKLWINFPIKYPMECLVSEVRSEDNELFPTGLIRHLTNSIKSWLKTRHEVNTAAGKVELMFRPFLKWFDKSLEEHFTNGLRVAKRDVEAEAAGIEFVPYEHLPGSQSSNVEFHDEKQFNIEKENQEKLISETYEALSKPLLNEMTNNYNEENSTTLPDPFGNKLVIPLNINDLKTPKSGTEIKLRNFQLGENTASVVCQKLHITIQCSRCKENHDIITEPRRKNHIPCPKCHQMQQVIFRPNMLHPFSAVLGYLDLLGCQAVDLPLVDSIFAVDCLNCNKQMSADGVHYGQMWTTWCHHCNVKLSIYIDSTKFQVLQPNSEIENGPSNLIKLEKKEKKVRDPSIQEGKPLPDYGTCKHFKKSFRWFRFPCCGKAYPCDLCHNERELEHEMKMATRVICGLCAKEQTFSSTKPCNTCGSSMTKISKDHWEGGKGCRDKTKMNRDDRHKYSGINKTCSRKITEQKEKNKKKQPTKAV